MDLTRACGNCRFCGQLKGKIWQCRRNAPKQDAPWHKRFPKTEAGAWCGEWRPEKQSDAHAASLQVKLNAMTQQNSRHRDMVWQLQRENGKLRALVAVVANQLSENPIPVEQTKTMIYLELASLNGGKR